MAERRKNIQDINRIIDAVHICTGVVIVIMAVAAFIDSDKYMFFFPIIFLLAAILDIVNGIQKLRESEHDKKKKATAVLVIFLGAVLVILSIISGISIWG